MAPIFIPLNPSLGFLSPYLSLKHRSFIFVNLFSNIQGGSNSARTFRPILIQLLILFLGSCTTGIYRSVLVLLKVMLLLYILVLILILIGTRLLNI